MTTLPRRIKKEYDTPPENIPEGEAKGIWEQMDNEVDAPASESNIYRVNENIVRSKFENNCVLQLCSA